MQAYYQIVSYLDNEEFTYKQTFFFLVFDFKKQIPFPFRLLCRA